MKSKNLITLLMALGLAAIVAWLGNTWIESRLDLNQEEMVNVVVATADIPPYSTVAPNLLRLDTRPRGLVPPDHISDPSTLVGKKLREPVYQGEVMVSKRLADDAAASPLLEALPPGLRAMTLRLDDISGHAGFLLPGSRVDIISLQSGHAATILKNIKVIAVGQTLIAEGSTVKGGTVTLEVTSRQAEILTEVSSAGGVRLVLRRQNDDTGLEVDETGPVVPPAMREATGEVSATGDSASPKEEKPAEPETFPVVVIRGITSQIIPFTKSWGVNP